jgi:capsular polysaccharide export protein
MRSFARVSRASDGNQLTDDEIDSLIADARRLRVGGSYWDPGCGSDNWLQASSANAAELRQRFRREAVGTSDYVNPFTNQPMSIAETIGLCAFWRELIDSNREIGTAVGFAFWKRPTAAALLWDGSDGPRFTSRMRDIDCKRPIAVWKSRTACSVLAELERSNAKLIEVEDGFIRSAGLGADCVPPLSIVVDRLGAHFDPSRPSELERLLEKGDFPTDLLERAGRLRELIVASGLGKYGGGGGAFARRGGGRLHVLVPGQVEDDRAVTSSASPVKTNLELLRHVRESRPAAYIIYKAHPDVEAGHRPGSLSDEDCLRFADEVVREASITSVIEAADEVHVMTSLAGFEALLRGTPVITYGTPFYAGWGLTTDIGHVPARRTAKRSINELIAAVLLLYPRYLDPVTGLPCPPEILISRLAEGSPNQSAGMVVKLRRLQGRWRKRLAKVGLR